MHCIAAISISYEAYSSFLCLQDPVQQARTTQEQTTKLLAQLLQASDTAATARAHVNSIDEEFFMVSSTYLDMASSLHHSSIAAFAASVAVVCAASGSQGGQQGSMHQTGARSQNRHGGEAEDTTA